MLEKMKYTSGKIRELFAVIIKAVAIRRLKITRKKFSRDGKSSRYCVRNSVAHMFRALDPIYFRKAYQLTYKAFLDLYEILEDSQGEVIGASLETH